MLKKVASMLLALALLVSPMKLVFAENGAWDRFKGKAVAAGQWVADRKWQILIGIACVGGFGILCASACGKEGGFYGVARAPIAELNSPRKEEAASDLERFRKKQTPELLKKVENELRQGSKRSHWIWYIFPQAAGLGMSSESRYYGVKSLDEAKAYLADPVLGDKLIYNARLVLRHKGSKTLEEIFGYPDFLKFISSMTLFSAAKPSATVFVEVLNAFNDGNYDAETLIMLGLN
ncbi:MAG: DUF1810 domain-containing protein [Endomicrobium sp.]|jgi:uncharacterized protein (DUF1810 family)|nr:DUF1810 domain-containing protein [Endomicrobium sp.]